MVNDPLFICFESSYVVSVWVQRLTVRLRFAFLWLIDLNGVL